MDHIKKLTRFLKPYWKRATVALILLTSLVFMDLAIPRLIERIIDQGITAKNQSVVLQTSLVMIGISILSAVIAVANSVLSVQVGEGLARDLREALFAKIQTYSFGNLDRQNTGQLMVRLTSDVGALKLLTQVSLRIGTRAPLLMVGSLILMFSTSQNLALTMLPLLLVTTVLIVFFIVKMEPLFLSVQQKLDRLNTVLQENVAGVYLVKAFVRADFEGKRFEVANEDFAARSIKVMEFMSSMSPALTMCVNIGMVIVIWAGGLQSIRGDLTIGQIVAFTNYLLTVMTPLTMMTMLSNNWANGIVSAKRVDEILDTVPEVQDAPDAVSLPDDAPGRVVFEHVSFHYKNSSDEPVLEDVNLVIEPGQTVAVLGATGSGKSTLAHLVPRFYDAVSGRVLIDGVDARCIRQDSLLSKIAIVPQETILFSGTVRDNIRYGNPSASEEQVVAAAKAAQAHDFIAGFPQGYDTHIEERGVNLSGGQKQRVAIARALLTRPKILILDDSTSAVDVETETKIQDALATQAFNHTTLVVAQRISTVLRADKIVVIDDGRIAAEGTHTELMQSSPIYREIYESQLGNGVRLEEAALSTQQEN
ncbi:MAG: ABC transporter ATP-binding protein [Anaerolineales bacterium]